MNTTVAPTELNRAVAPTFNERHSLAIRIWHWIFFILVTSTILTVVLATFVLDTGGTIPLVQGQLQQKGVSVDKAQARAVSHAFNDILWELHTWIGYFIALFVLGRFLLEIFQPGEEKLRVKIRNALGFAAVAPEQAQEKRHYLRVKWGYVLFYFLILTMAITGLILAFEDAPMLKALQGSARSVHSFTQWLIYAFILCHLTGVIAADARRYPGIVSGMINGKSGMPARKN